MRIVADLDIASVGEAFAEFGEVRLVPGRACTPALVRDADILLVRSVTQVDARLLRGSAVRFVGSATSGVDHVDVEYLRSHRIGFASASGSNATAVAEYVLSAVLVLAAERGLSLSKINAAIIGCGHVGSRVLALLEAAGIRCAVNDPPLKEATGEDRFQDLEDLIIADIVSLHAPLTRTGRYPTHRLFDTSKLARLKADAVLINTARGGVVDEAALITQLDRRGAMSAVIDCWEHEPEVDRELLRRVALGTGHIAGHSEAAKRRATGMIHAAACAHFDRSPEWQSVLDESSSRADRLVLSPALGEEEALRQAVLAGYDVREDSAALKRMLGMPRAQHGAYFDALRKSCRRREEFSDIAISISASNTHLAARLTAMGFKVELAQ